MAHAADSDVLILATTATRPICGPDDVAASLVVSLGADTEDQRELKSSWVSSANVYVDSLDSERVGDLQAWLAEKVIERGEVTALCQL
ncbi:MAG: hypothetical protein M3088_05615, partial [Actinomycetota bacterium]|nr:hypothetical protein [Actinomycetota bacterium]